MSDTFIDPATGEAHPERRQNPALRSVFDAVYVQIEPFFDPKNTWGGQSLGQLAYRVVRESYPELTREEVHQVIIAASRVFHRRNPHLSGQAPSPDSVAAELLR
ncbi:hypothetical protein [Azospira inquinata]|uniref:Uncharacterized protein n=1 Tax=Azospira inquinata TaxID=2785627 RepID=A0A975XV86_9RHOO|nr:hypothetical protein [Azospira inquinata]QWT45102.1 hypothetical protein J8L76_09050 [Azospira inquinata]QWT49564.1 hypothetical protein Azoinq_02830 [Azospira inquinata]